MQRLTAIITLIAFFTINSIPVLAAKPVCTHTTHTADANHDINDMDCHDKPVYDLSEATLSDMDMADMGMSDMDMAGTDLLEKTGTESAVKEKIVTHQDTASEKKPYCRIECGCGCNSSPDSFPVVLTPYLPSQFQAQIIIVETRVAATDVATLTSLAPSPNIPPPKL